MLDGPRLEKGYRGPTLEAWGRGSFGSAWWPWVRIPGSEGSSAPAVLGGSQRCGPWDADPWLNKHATGTWNVTSQEGKEPELVCEVEKYGLNIVRLTSTHSMGSGINLRERGWTLFDSGVAQGEKRQARVGLLIAPWLGWSLYVGVLPGK